MKTLETTKGGYKMEPLEIKELRQSIEVLKMENRGLRLCMTKPAYRFTSKPEDVKVDASKLTWQ